MELDKLLISLEGNADNAEKSIDSVIASLKRLDGVSSGLSGLSKASLYIKDIGVSMGLLKQNTSGLSSTADGITQISSALKNLSASSGGMKQLISDSRGLSIAFQNIGKAAAGLTGISAKTGDIKFNIDPAQITAVSSAISQMANTMLQIQNVGSGMANFSANVRSVSSALGTLGANLPKLNIDTSGFAKVGSDLQALSSAITGTVDDVVKLGTFASSLNKLAKSAPKFATSVPTITNSLRDLINQLNSLPTASSNVNTLISNLSKLASNSKGMSSSLKSATNSAKLFGNNVANSANGMATATKKSTSLLGGLYKLHSAFAAFATAKHLGDMLASFVNRSVSFIEDMNLFSVATGKSADRLHGFITDMSTAFSLDPSFLVRNTGLFFQMANAIGVTSKNSETLSKNFTMLTADLSSLFNISLESAAEKLQSGLAGMSRPLRELGIDTSMAALQQTALAKGITQSVKSMDRATKTWLIHETILRQTTKAQGDWARTIMTPAQQLKQLNENFKMLSRSIGNLFIGTLGNILPIINAVIKAVTILINRLAQLIGYKAPKIGGFEELGVDIEDDTDSAADLNKELKKAKDITMGFDELNIISPDQKDDVSDALGAIGDGLGGNVEFTTYDNLMDTVSDKTKKLVDDILKWFDMLKIDPVTTIAKTIWDMVEGLFDLGDLLSGSKLSPKLIDLLNFALANLAGTLMLSAFGVPLPLAFAISAIVSSGLVELLGKDVALDLLAGALTGIGTAIGLMAIGVNPTVAITIGAIAGVLIPMLDNITGLNFLGPALSGVAAGFGMFMKIPGLGALGSVLGAIAISLGTFVLMNPDINKFAKGGLLSLAGGFGAMALAVKKLKIKDLTSFIQTTGQDVTKFGLFQQLPKDLSKMNDATKANVASMRNLQKVLGTGLIAVGLIGGAFVSTGKAGEELSVVLGIVAGAVTTLGVAMTMGFGPAGWALGAIAGLVVAIGSIAIAFDNIAKEEQFGMLKLSDAEIDAILEPYTSMVDGLRAIGDEMDKVFNEVKTIKTDMLKQSTEFDILVAGNIKPQWTIQETQELESLMKDYALNVKEIAEKQFSEQTINIGAMFKSVDVEGELSADQLGLLTDMSTMDKTINNAVTKITEDINAIFARAAKEGRGLLEEEVRKVEEYKRKIDNILMPKTTTASATQFVLSSALAEADYKTAVNLREKYIESVKLGNEELLSNQASTVKSIKDKALAAQESLKTMKETDEGYLETLEATRNIDEKIRKANLEATKDYNSQTLEQAKEFSKGYAEILKKNFDVSAVVSKLKIDGMKMSDALALTQSKVKEQINLFAKDMESQGYKIDTSQIFKDAFLGMSDELGQQFNSEIKKAESLWGRSLEEVAKSAASPDRLISLLKDQGITEEVAKMISEGYITGIDKADEEIILKAYGLTRNVAQALTPTETDKEKAWAAGKDIPQKYLEGATSINKEWIEYQDYLAQQVAKSVDPLANDSGIITAMERARQNGMAIPEQYINGGKELNPEWIAFIDATKQHVGELNGYLVSPPTGDETMAAENNGKQIPLKYIDGGRSINPEWVKYQAELKGNIQQTHETLVSPPTGNLDPYAAGMSGPDGYVKGAEEGIKKSQPTLLASIGSFISNVFSAFGGKKKETKADTSIGDSVIAISTGASQEAQSEMKNSFKALGESAITGLTSGLSSETAKSMINTATMQVMSIMETNFKTLFGAGTANILYKYGQESVNGIVSGVNAKLNDVKAPYENLGKLAITSFTNAVTATWNSQKEASTKFATDFTESLKKIWPTSETVLASSAAFKRGVQSLFEQIMLIVNTFKSNFTSGIQTAWDSATNAQSSRSATMLSGLNTFSGQYTSAWKQMLNKMLSDTETFSNNLLRGWYDTQTQIAQMYNKANPTLPQITISYPTTVSIPKLAQGGVLTSGQLFIANEKAPELVGNVGKQTLVANNEDLLSTAANVMAEKFMEQYMMYGTVNESEKEITVNNIMYLDGEIVYKNQEKIKNSKGVKILTGGVVNG